MTPISAPPMLWPSFHPIPEAYYQNVMAMTRWHMDCPEESMWDDDGELTMLYPFAASRGPVQPHTDEMDNMAFGKRVFGLVLHSEGHVLYSSRDGSGKPLRRGDVYSLDPYDRHWTMAPAGAVLVFAATFLPSTDHRYFNLPQIIHDLSWDGMRCLVDFERAQQQRRSAYQGVEPIGNGLHR